MARRSLAATLSVVRIINLRAIRRHTLRALLAAISLGGGVAIVVAVMIETSSVRAAIDDVGYRIAGPTPLRIVGERRLEASTPRFSIPRATYRACQRSCRSPAQ